MFGTEYTQYLRSRNIRGKPASASTTPTTPWRSPAELFNKLGMVELAVEYGLTEEGDGPQATASMALVQRHRG